MSIDEFDAAGWAEGRFDELRSRSTAKRVLVTGGRSYPDTSKVFTILSDLHWRLGVSCIIQGGADGADYAAKLWAARFDVPIEEYLPDWKQYGRRAGPIRNQQMIEQSRADICIAFPGGRGTADMTRRSVRAGIETVIID